MLSLAIALQPNMYALDKLNSRVSEIQEIERTMIEKSLSSLHTRPDLQAKFKAAVTSSNELIKGELGALNGFGTQLFTALSSGGSYLPITQQIVMDARSNIEAAIEQIAAKPVLANVSAHPEKHYVSLTRLSELRLVSNGKYDLVKLVRLAEELNTAYRNECVISCAMLSRAIVDHVPPIFGAKNFDAVAESYPWSKSNKALIKKLNESMRNIADQHLHGQIREKEVLPSVAQVVFSSELDVLLSEVERILK
jgi:hypothetical protein